ncbi:MAG: magnesium transporter [SAR324 cluster bacterium]|jgi:magnesium transporter|nr:magnesium transporter [SAR324 cluster bacterium]|tara:strand:+ start:1197 stop:2573 length:1377 start_codon:yes stop_codon:yes gene_type:complete
MTKSRDTQIHKLVNKLINTERTQLLKSILEPLKPLEIANILLQLKLKQQLVLLENLDRGTSSEVLNNLQDSPSILGDIVEQISTDRLSNAIEDMPQDDAADFVGLLDDEKAEALLEKLPEKDREELTNLLQYDEESAGGLMTPYVVAIHRDQTVAAAIKEIQKFVKKEGFELFYTAYVVDDHDHLIGTIGTTELLLAERHKLIENLMDHEVVAVDQDLDQEEVARIAQEYDLVVVPVIDKHLRLIGRITLDDLVDVIVDEYNEDMGHIAGTGDEEVSETSVLRASGDRLPWLLVGLFGGFLTAIVMSLYENALISLPDVTYFIPLVAALGGSIGIQSSSIVVRGLATGAIQTTDILVRLWKELRVAFLNGIICSFILAGMSWYLTDDVGRAITSGISLLIVVCFAAVVGSTIPIILKRMNIDPAIATGPFITTTSDIIGIAIYLGFAFNVSFSPLFNS